MKPSITQLLRKGLKVIAWIVGLLIMLILLLHVPLVQRTISQRAANYVTQKTGGKIEVEAIYFSLLGDLSVVELRACDPNEDCFLTIEKLYLDVGLLSLIRGQFVVNELDAKGISGTLLQGEDALNIQYLIDAFASPAATTDTVPREEPAGFAMQVGQLHLEDTDFTLRISDGVDLFAFVGDMNGTGIDFSLAPNKITASSIHLVESGCHLLLPQREGTIQPLEDTLARTMQMLTFDFYSGFQFNIDTLSLLDNAFSLHQGEKEIPSSFDPEHLVIDDIQLLLSDAMLHEDSLRLKISDLGASFPGLQVVDFATSMAADSSALSIERLAMETTRSQVTLSTSMAYTDWVNLLESEEHLTSLQMDLRGRVNATELGWLSDSLGRVMGSIGTDAGIMLDARVAKDLLELKGLSVSLGGSEVKASGKVANLYHQDRLSWQELLVTFISKGPLTRVVESQLQGIMLPGTINGSFNSSGNLSEVRLVGGLRSAWGSLKLNGGLELDAPQLVLDIVLDAEQLDAGKFVDEPMLGPVTMQVEARGAVGEQPDLDVSTTVRSILINGEPINDLDVSGTFGNELLTATIESNDPRYMMKIDSEVRLADTVKVKTTGSFDRFDIGTVLEQDRVVLLSGRIDSEVAASNGDLMGELEWYDFTLADSVSTYQLDTLRVSLALPEGGSAASIASDHFEGNYQANFGFDGLQELVVLLRGSALELTQEQLEMVQARNFQLDFVLRQDDLLEWLGLDVQELSNIRMNASLAEGSDELRLTVTTDRLKMYDAALDTFRLNLTVVSDELDMEVGMQRLMFDSTLIGSAALSLVGKNDTIKTGLSVERDSVILTDIVANFTGAEDKLLLSFDTIIAFNAPFEIIQQRPIEIDDRAIVVHPISIVDDRVQLKLQSDSTLFELEIIDGDLFALNQLFEEREEKLRGLLNADIFFDRETKLVDFEVKLDCLRLGKSPAASVVALVTSDSSSYPFQLEMMSERNHINAKGAFPRDDLQRIDATVSLSLQNLEEVRVLTGNTLSKLTGEANGEFDVSGELVAPEVIGSLDFKNVGLTTTQPKLTFNIKDASLSVDDNGLFFDDFKVYDERDNPLVLNGYLRTTDYSSFEYDFTITTDNYLLINNPYKEPYLLQGVLALGSDLKFTGSKLDTDVSGSLIIRDTTNFVIVPTQSANTLKTDEGIVAFVDPNSTDTLDFQATSLYDSIISTLPKFDLNTNLGIEKKAKLKLIIDAESGDFVESTGSADLDISVDRTGNVGLSGSYTIEEGLYKLSFYDIVQKDFVLLQGSGITWNGIPDEGVINVKAVNIIKTSSLTLMGNEIGESQKDTYRRSLPYEVTIIIKGTVNAPDISFALDLPQEEKNNYPALANKLNRLNQPEFESDLNKQVFGLLVLGGFLPDLGQDVNQGVLVNTAISNSVNSILSNQLNQFAEGLIKGVDIDVGLQSYSEFTTGGGETRTAMDFRVTKQLMNDRLSIQAGGSYDISAQQSGANRGSNYRGDVAIIYDLTKEGKGANRQLKLFNNQTYDIIYHDIRNMGISFIVIRDLDKKEGD